MKRCQRKKEGGRRCGRRHDRDHAWCGPCYSSYMSQWKRKKAMCRADGCEKQINRAYSELYCRRHQRLRDEAAREDLRRAS